MKKKVFLTGATGLLGSHILREGLGRGCEFAVLCREIKQNTYLHQVKDLPEVRVIEGDLLNLDLSAVPKDIQTVIHSAALVSAKSEEKDLMKKINVDGTKKLFGFFESIGANWVQISSVSTLCSGHRKLVDESCQGDARDTEYARTKLSADNWIDAQVSKSLIIHPCYMFGEWDARPSSGIILYALRFKKITHYFNSVKNFVSARDVANGIWQAIEKNATGHFLLGNQNFEIKKFFEIACREMNLPMSLVEVNEEVLGENDLVREFCSSSAVNFDKAKSAFGYVPKHSLAESLRESIDYFTKFKMLPKRSGPKA